jgi:hypothetical protein
LSAWPFSVQTRPRRALPRACHDRVSAGHESVPPPGVSVLKQFPLGSNSCGNRARRDLLRQDPRGKVQTRTRLRDDDGHVRQVSATGVSRTKTERHIKEVLARLPNHVSSGNGRALGVDRAAAIRTRPPPAGRASRPWGCPTPISAQRPLNQNDVLRRWSKKDE